MQNPLLVRLRSRALSLDLTFIACLRFARAAAVSRRSNWSLAGERPPDKSGRDRRHRKDAEKDRELFCPSIAMRDSNPQVDDCADQPHWPKNLRTHQQARQVAPCMTEQQAGKQKRESAPQNNNGMHGALLQSGRHDAGRNAKSHLLPIDSPAGNRSSPDSGKDGQHGNAGQTQRKRSDEYCQRKRGQQKAARAAEQKALAHEP